VYVDSHIHLADEAYKGRVDRIVEEARRAGVKIIVANSEDLETSLRTLELAEAYPPTVLPALGVHPWCACEAEDSEVGEVSNLILKHGGRLAAVGEVGLDLAYARGKQEAWDRQKKVFSLMLETAERVGLPVIAHSRRSAGEVLEVALTYRVKMVFHWFSGEIQVLRRILDEGFYITVGPSIHYSKHIQRVAAEAPLTSILTETDGPVRYRGPFESLETTPTLIPMVVEKLAEVKGLKPDEVALQILKNCEKVFPAVQSLE